MPLRTSFPSEWDKQAANWDKGIHSPKWPHYHYYKTFDVYLPKTLSKCTRVLELGCGTADSTINFAPYADEIFASDFSKEMIRIAAKKIESSGFAEKVHLAVLDAQNIPFTDEYFDGVFSRGGLINYVPHPDVLLHEICRVLIQGGKLVFDMITRKPGGEASLYSKNQVEKLLKIAKFSSADFRPMGMFLHLWRNRELMNFINEHRDIFCRIEVEMAKAFKPAKSSMMLILTNKP
jgi:ubiquinone/menaquinone biosynthesis C-methylase UbiE